MRISTGPQGTIEAMILRRLLLAALLLLLPGGSASALQEQEKSPPSGPPYRVGGDVKRPEKISGLTPAYTAEARRARVTGVVIVETLIDEQGNVTETRVIKGLPMGLEEAAVEAVRSWKFKPATLEGQPVPVYYVLTINFQLDKPPVFGPLFEGFLKRNPNFAEHLRAGRYQEAAALLDRWAREQPEDSEIRLARAYLFLEQGRLEEGWKEARAYRGPEPYEVIHRAGVAAWEQVQNGTLDLANAIELGLEAETMAMAARPSASEAVTYKSLLLREKAKLTSKPKERRALTEEADRLQGQALELQKREQAPVSGSVTRPVKISGFTPETPEEARKAGVSGVVILEAVIDELGNVQDVRVLKGLHPALDEKAAEALRTWKFKPATMDGKPVKVYYTMTMNFR